MSSSLGRLIVSFDRFRPVAIEKSYKNQGSFGPHKRMAGERMDARSR